jgi:hypothetical protein
MSSTTEPDSTSITEENIATSQQGVKRLQGGGLRFLDAHEIPQRDFNVVTRPFQNNNTRSSGASSIRRWLFHDPAGEQRPVP